jgi:hypothetical protein
MQMQQQMKQQQQQMQQQMQQMQMQQTQQQPPLQQQPPPQQTQHHQQQQQHDWTPQAMQDDANDALAQSARARINKTVDSVKAMRRNLKGMGILERGDSVFSDDEGRHNMQESATDNTPRYGLQRKSTLHQPTPSTRAKDVRLATRTATATT